MLRRATIGSVLAALALIVVCACGVAGAAIRRGSVSPPQFAVDLGSVQVLGRLSTVPVCSYATSCLLDPSGRDIAIYTLWMIQRPSQPGAPSRAIRLASMVVDDGS
jgi:hypothetical protein